MSEISKLSEISAGLLFWPFISAANGLINADPHIQQQLSKFSGTVIGLSVSTLPLSASIRIKPDGLLEIKSATEHHVQIAGSSSSLMRLLIDKNPPSFKQLGIHVQGDIDLLHRLSRLFQQMDIDWEGRLAYWLGDTPAHYICEQSSELLEQAQSVQSTLSQNITEYWQEEQAYLPPPLMVQDFGYAVDDLILDVDRLCARINRLSNTLLSNTFSGKSMEDPLT